MAKCLVDRMIVGDVYLHEFLTETHLNKVQEVIRRWRVLDTFFQHSSLVFILCAPPPNVN